MADIQYPVNDYLDLLQKQSFPSIAGDETLERLRAVKTVYGQKITDQVGIETHLGKTDKTIDFSFREPLDNPVITDRWYELDNEAWDKPGVPPCICVDAQSLGPEKDCSAFFSQLTDYISAEQVNLIKPHLKRAADALAGIGTGFFQLGMYTGRGVTDRVRLFTNEMSFENVITYLHRMNWGGDFSALQEAITPFLPWFPKQTIIDVLDFDLLADGSISEKIGFETDLFSMSTKKLASFLDYLKNQNLCLPEKADDVQKWSDIAPSSKPLLFNVISHFKIIYQNDCVKGVKAYLRMSPNYPKPFRFYDAPVLMNLELTDRCPLHCPQCYCSLTGKTDMKLETAMHWIEEANKNHVTSICLSGGETMCYPYLNELVETISGYGMSANVALSGAYVTKEKLRQLIDRGVDEICVSLNGSTREINDKTRDGYDLAIQTLEYLYEMKFPKITINWVMHSYNADDFENMILLAEKYNVNQIDVMVFKPNARHELPSLPDKKQMLNVAKIIRKYKGPVLIYPESCFSQMRALVNQNVFFNANLGIDRGCGAGRDSISITIDGLVTPCRHLQFEEKFTTIEDYWNNSKIIKELRKSEETIEEPCSNCKYMNNCLPCTAVNVKLHNRKTFSNKECMIHEPKS